MSTQMCGDMGMTLRQAVANEANTWQTGSRQMQMVMVTSCGTITCQGTCAMAENISCMNARAMAILYLRDSVEKF